MNPKCLTFALAAAAGVALPAVLNADVIISDNFEGGGVNSTLTLQNFNGDPAAVTDGALRLTNLTGSNENQVSWDAVEAPGTSSSIGLSFDYSATDDEANTAAGGCCNDAADGFGIGLFLTSVHGETGDSAKIGGVWEANSSKPEGVSMHFDFFNEGNEIGGNNLRLNILGQFDIVDVDIQGPFMYNNNLQHHVEWQFFDAGNGSSNMNLRIIEDVNGARVIHDVISDLNVPFDVGTIDDFRLIAGGRTGGAYSEVKIDNLNLSNNVAPLGPVDGAGEVLANNGDSWVRENDPATSFAGDLSSVWNSSGGDLRYGVISFDVGSLTEPVTEVSLSLWSQAFGFSDDAVPLKQTAIAIDPDGIDPDAATWDDVTAAATLHTFGGLGTYDIGAPSSTPEIDGVYLESVGTAADAAFMESVRTGAGTLMVVLIADEDEENFENYRGSWGDGELGGEDAFLSTNAAVDAEVPGDDPNLATDPMLAFGQVTPGDGPLVQTLTVTNTGALEVLTVSGATITGASAAQFAVTGGTFPLPVNPGESSNIEITFDPGESLGLFEATLELASDDENDPVVLVTLNGFNESPSEGEMLINNGDSWVRENDPATSFGSDLSSVWNSSGGDLRYGVISFNVGSLTKPVTEVSLSLWSQAFGFSDDAVPLKQSAIAVDPEGIDPDAATWDDVSAAATLYTFGGLGTYEIGAPSSTPEIDGVYLESVGTAADAAFVESVRTGSGTLMIVMIAAEDEENFEDYRASWGDGELGGEDSFLTLTFGTAGPGFRIVDIRHAKGSSEVSFDFTSRPGGTYIIEVSSDLEDWRELDDSFPSAGELTTFTESGLDPGLEERYYRVQQN